MHSCLQRTSAVTPFWRAAEQSISFDVTAIQLETPSQPGWCVCHPLPRPNAIVGAIGSCPCPLLGCPLLGCPFLERMKGNSPCPFVERMIGNSPCPFVERMIGNSPCPPIGCGNRPCPPIGCGNRPCPPIGCGNSPCPPIGCPLLERMMGNTVDRANPSQCSYITKYYMAKCGQVGGATTSRSATQSPASTLAYSYYMPSYVFDHISETDISRRCRSP